MGIIDRAGALYWATGIDNSGMRRDAEETKRIIESISRSVKTAGMMIGTVFGTHTLSQFMQKIISVRGEMQMLESNFETLLGSRSKSDKMLADIKKYAIESPLSLSGVSKAAQLLLGFNVEAEKTIPILKQIGDISMGNEQRFQSLTLAFAQMSSLGKLMGQDLNQMINAGFNPLQEIARKTGKSISDLRAEMEKGAVSSEMVADAFRTATEEGGKFHGMTQKQAEGIKGLQAQLVGSIEEMFNELGKRSEGFVSNVYKSTNTLVQNYEKVGRVLASLVVTYGAYKAAVVAVTVAEKGWTMASMTQYRWLLLVEKAQKMLNATMLKNPYVAATVAVVGLVSVLVSLRDKTTAQEKAQEILNKVLEEARDRKEALINNGNELIRILNDETGTVYQQVKAYRELIALLPELKGKSLKDLQAMDPGDLTKMLGKKADEGEKSAIQSSYEESLKNIENIRKKITDLEGKDIRQVGYELSYYRKRLEEVTIEAENYKKQLEEIREIEKGAEDATSQQQAIIRNKEYWEGVKKAAEDARAKMASNEEGSEEWKRLTSEIANASKELDKYSDKQERSSKSSIVPDTSTFNELKRKQGIEQERIVKDVVFSIEQAEIDAMKEGHEKVERQMKLNHKRELEELDRQKEDFLQRKKDNARALFEANPANAGKTFDSSGITLSNAEKAYIKEIEKQTKARQEKESQELLDRQRETMNQYLAEYGDYLERRQATTDLYNEKMAKALTEGEKLMLQKELEKVLSSLDDEVSEKIPTIARLFSDMSDKSIEELREIRDEAERLWDFLSGGKWDAQAGASFGMRKELFDSIVSDPEKLSKFKKGLDNVKEAIYQLDTPIGRINEGFKELFDPRNNGTNKQIEALGKLKQGFEDVAQAVKNLGKYIDSISGLLGKESTLSNDISKLVDIGSDIGGTVASAMTGDFAGAAKGYFEYWSKIFNWASENKKHRAELRKQIKENQDKEHFGQLEIEEVYRRKYEWAKKTGETTLNHIKRQGEELEKQAKANEKAQNDLWEKLKREQYKSGEHFKKTGLFGWGKGKIVEEWTSLAGKTWDDIEALAAQGKLSEEGMKFYEALVKARKEGKDIADMELDFMERLRETTIGSPYESIVSGIVDGFKQGKRSAADFANSFEDLMQGAVESSLTLLANKKMRQWYEDFAEAGGGGYTKDEIEKAKREWIQLNKDLAEQAKQLEEVTGRKFGDVKSGVTGELKREMTEETGSQLVGLWNLTAMKIIEIKEFLERNPMPDYDKDLYNIQNELYAINQNTRETADNTQYNMQGFKSLENRLEEIKKNMKQGNSRG